MTKLGFRILVVIQICWASGTVVLDGRPVFDNSRDSLNMRFIGQWSTPGYACQVCVQGPYAYVADYSRGLRVIDISNPAAPVEIGACDSVYDAVHVVVRDTVAYVASQAHGMYCVDVSSPRDPVVVGNFPALSTQGICNVDIEGAAHTAFATSCQS